MSTNFHPGTSFKAVSERPSFPQEEERIFKQWEDQDIFQ